jgi:hypothetical protein
MSDFDDKADRGPQSDWPSDDYPSGNLGPTAASLGGPSTFVPDPLPEPPPAEAPQVAPMSESRRLFIAAPVLAPRNTFLFRLARNLHLDVRGDSLLGQRNGEQLETAAVLLVVVAIFELSMWSLLFNSAIYSTPWNVGRLTPLAFCLAALFAAAVYVYEKSLITTDLSSARGWMKGLPAFAIRVVLIAASAYATAQPFELVMFNGQIEQRMRQETVLAEAMRQAKVQQSERIESKPKTPAEVEAVFRETDVGRRLSAARGQFTTSRQELDEANRNVERRTASIGAARSAINRAQQRLREAQGAAPPDFAAVTSAQRGVTAAQNQLAQADADLAAARTQQIAAQDGVKRATEGSSTAEANWQVAIEAALKKETERVKELEARIALRKAWMDRVQSASFGAPLTNPVNQQLLEWNTADFVDRLNIVEDVIAARGPRWPLSTEADRDQAIAMFQLPDTENVTLDQRAIDLQKVTRRLYWVSYVIALMIPLMTLGFKFCLISPELRAYYSSEAQERAGSPEALEFRRARGGDRRNERR